MHPAEGERRVRLADGRRPRRPTRAPRDSRYPLISMDETSKQIPRGVRGSLSTRPGDVAREDFEYERSGVANAFLSCAPLDGKRWVSGSDHRKRADWAHEIKDLVDSHFPTAERIVLVCDNLNTYAPAALYETYRPAEAKRLAERLEIHYTPKHSSWLNIAETELSVLSCQCLDQRVPDLSALQAHLTAWQERCSSAGVAVD